MHDSCHKDFSWVWSRSKAKDFKIECNASAECINISKPGYIYSREECRSITSAFYNYLVRQITTYKGLSLISADKKEYYDITLSEWSNHLLNKHDADVKQKITPVLEKKLKKVAKELRDFYIKGIDKLDLTKISNINLRRIAEANKLDYDTLLSEKENMKDEILKIELQREREFNYFETGLMETNEQRRSRESFTRTVDSIKKKPSPKVIVVNNRKQRRKPSPKVIVVNNRKQRRNRRI